MDVHIFEIIFFALFGGILLSILGWWGTRKAQFFPHSLQNLLEIAYQGLLGWYEGFMEDRKEAERYFPFFGSFFFYILLMNLLAIIPLFRSPTSYYLTTLSLALIALTGTWLIALHRLGPIGFAKHLVGEPWYLFPISFPVHLVEEIARIISLSIRLAANIFSEDLVLAVLIMLAVMFFPIWLPIPLPMPFMFLMVIFSTAQAIVFSTLTAVYIHLWLSTGEHH